MFGKKLINVLIKAQAWTAIICTGLGLIWSFWSASQVWDFAGGVGFFLGGAFVCLFYGSFWYIIMAAFYKYNNK